MWISEQAMWYRRGMYVYRVGKSFIFSEYHLVFVAFYDK